MLRTERLTQRNTVLGDELMSRYAVSYTTESNKTLCEVSADIAQAIHADIERLASFATNYAGGGNHRKQTVRGSTYTAECLLRHSAKKLIVLQLNTPSSQASF